MLNRPRVIPVLTINRKKLIKTIKFKNPRYLGDPLNSLKIFNNKGVDELCIIDIRASLEKRNPDLEYLKEIASEAFMPLSYGGGVNSIEQVKKLLYLGYEKIIFNSAFFNNVDLIKESVKIAGSQSVVLSVDVKKDVFGKYYLWTLSGTKKTKYQIIDAILEAKKIGVGEIIVNSISNDGLMKGYDIDLLKLISKSSNIPIVFCGGAQNTNDLKIAIDNGAHAVAAGSMFVYYGKQKGVLINFPTDKELYEIGLYK